MCACAEHCYQHATLAASLQMVQGHEGVHHMVVGQRGQVTSKCLLGAFILGGAQPFFNSLHFKRF
jgi:hypothetical protein